MALPSAGSYFCSSTRRAASPRRLSGHLFYRLDMCLLYAMLGAGVVLTLLSGQYSDHAILFWAFVVAVFLTAGFYKNQLNVAQGQAKFSLRTRKVIELGTGVFGVATAVLFVWLMVVIWI